MRVLTGYLLYNMLCAGAAAMEENRDRINDLNVFPVPDGDTGSNMTMTMQAVRTLDMPDTAESAENSVGDVARQAARLMMRSARGNSGVILSLFFRGVARAFDGCAEADGDAVLAAFREGAVQAASAVDRPVEGTILTVMRECTTDVSVEDDMAQLFTAILHRAEEILAATPDMLPALRRARVVDSGGAGFVAILGGMTGVLTGEIPTVGTETGSARTRTHGDDVKNTVAAEEEIRFGFCTECLLDLTEAIPGETLVALRGTLQSMGDSMVLTADEEMCKVHIHTNEPMRVLEMLLPLGVLRASKVENMRLQHDGVVKRKENAANHALHTEKNSAALLDGVKNTLRDVAEPLEGTIARLLRTARPEKEPEALRKYAVVAAADGDGFCDLFREMGAAAVVPLNPSPEDFLRAIRAELAENVILLPNNKNALLAARQAAELAMTENTKIRVEILPTRLPPQGISALFAFHESRDLMENLENMRSAAAEVTVLSFTTAARDAETDGVMVRARDVLGLQNGVIRVSVPTLMEAVEVLLPAIADCPTVSLYYGHDLKRETAEKIFAHVEKALPDADVTEVDGGQSVYPLLITGE